MEIYREIAKYLDQGKPFILATLIRVSGSAPREAGAKMLVFSDGSISGTIGGGNFEKMVIDDCLALFGGDSASLLKSYLFQESGPEATGMFCGGKADVFMERFSSPDKLFIFGGGHIGRDLARVASDLNFRIAVIDDRPEILAQYQKPIETILTDSDYNRDFPVVDKNSYVVIVTRGHKCDRQVLAKVIYQDCAYIGMIGSKNKISKTFASLEEEGIEKSKLENVHSPIGLAIGAEGPYEIAIAIAAEIIAVKRKRTAKNQIMPLSTTSVRSQGT
jgi:xanthine dehydrogenase accessory factor